jgi:hypothetical protein
MTSKENTPKYLRSKERPEGEDEAGHEGALSHMSDRMRKLRKFLTAIPGDCPLAIIAPKF